MGLATLRKDTHRVRGLRGALVQDGKWEIVVRTITSVVDLGVPAQEVAVSDVVSGHNMYELARQCSQSATYV